MRCITPPRSAVAAHEGISGVFRRSLKARGLWLVARSAGSPTFWELFEMFREVRAVRRSVEFKVRGQQAYVTTSHWSHLLPLASSFSGAKIMGSNFSFLPENNLITLRKFVLIICLFSDSLRGMLHRQSSILITELHISLMSSEYGVDLPNSLEMIQNTFFGIMEMRICKFFCFGQCKMLHKQISLALFHAQIQMLGNGKCSPLSLISAQN